MPVNISERTNILFYNSLKGVAIGLCLIVSIIALVFMFGGDWFSVFEEANNPFTYIVLCLPFIFLFIGKLAAYISKKHEV